MIRACRANASDGILCAVLGQNAVSLSLFLSPTPTITKWNFETTKLGIIAEVHSICYDRFMVHSPDIVASQLAYAILITYIFQFLRLFLIPGWWIPTAECGIVAWLRLASQTLSNYPDLLSCIFLRNISSKSKLIGKITIIRGIWYICLRRACCRRNNTKGWHSPLHSKFI